MKNKNNEEKVEKGETMLAMAKYLQGFDGTHGAVSPQWRLTFWHILLWNTVDLNYLLLFCSFLNINGQIERMSFFLIDIYWTKY